jgi:dCTP deaminase
MRLSDTDIRKEICETGEIGVDPFVDEHVNGASIDLRLADTFIRQRPLSASIIEPGVSTPNMVTTATKKGDAIILSPQEFILGSTIERVSIPKYMVGHLDGRSTFARYGLIVHITAHTLQPGWAGNVTLELFNAGPFHLKLTPGTRICQVSFELLTSPSTGYKGRYQNAVGTAVGKRDNDEDSEGC